MAIFRRVPRPLEPLLAEVTAALTRLYPKRLVSLILYGSAARGEYVSKRSDVNLLLVMDEVNASTLEELRVSLRQFSSDGVAPPVVIEESELARHAGVFAVELSDIREAYRVLAGRDCVSGWRIQSADLQAQVRHEVHRAVMRLRRGNLESGGDAAALRALLTAAYHSGLALVAGLSRASGAKGARRSEHLARVGSGGTLRPEVWERMRTLESGATLSDPDVRFLYGDFLEELERLADRVEGKRATRRQ